MILCIYLCNRLLSTSLPKSAAQWIQQFVFHGLSSSSFTNEGHRKQAVYAALPHTTKGKAWKLNSQESYSSLLIRSIFPSHASLYKQSLKKSAPLLTRHAMALNPTNTWLGLASSAPCPFASVNRMASMYAPAPPRPKKTGIVRARTGCKQCRLRPKKVSTLSFHAAVQY